MLFTPSWKDPKRTQAAQMSAAFAESKSVATKLSRDAFVSNRLDDHMAAAAALDNVAEQMSATYGLKSQATRPYREKALLHHEIVDELNGKISNAKHSQDFLKWQSDLINNAKGQ